MNNRISEPIFTVPVFELPMPKYLKPESACIEMLNLFFHIGKIKNSIKNTTDVLTMDSEYFFPLKMSVDWHDLKKVYSSRDDDWIELNQQLKSELLATIENIESKLTAEIKSNNSKIDKPGFPFLMLSTVEQAIIGYMLNPSREYDRKAKLFNSRLRRRSEDLEVGVIVDSLNDRFSEVEIRQALEPENALISDDFILVDVRELTEDCWEGIRLRLNYAKIFPRKDKDAFFNSVQLLETISPNVNLTDLELGVELKQQIDGILNLYKKGKVSPLSFLFFGDSGSGKTSLVHAIAKELGLDIVIVRDYVSSEKELPSAIHFLMRKYKNKKVLILFDECENLWYENSFVFQRSGSRSKEKNWSKHLLENPNGIIAFTSNFAPPAAFLRRVTLAAELAVPNEDLRAKILVDKSKGLCQKLNLECAVTPDNFKDLSHTYGLTGAFLERAVTLSLVYSENELTKSSLEKALKSILTLSGKSESDNSMKDRGLVFTEKQKQLVDVLKNVLERKKKDTQDPLLPKSTSLMLYGPPGTGKTEFAKALSNKLNLKLKMTTASDFLSKYVGESEQNIAHIFKQAAKNKEILFIDEVEGLFMGRESAQRSWELTQIGEFLKQIESFDGVLVVATNHKQMIDQAFARRFMFQVEFDYPEYTDRLALLRRFIGNKLSDSELSVLANEHKFSPGELRNATALWSVFENQSVTDLSLKIQEQINMRSLQKSRVIGLA